MADNPTAIITTNQPGMTPPDPDPDAGAFPADPTAADDATGVWSESGAAPGMMEAATLMGPGAGPAPGVMEAATFASGGEDAERAAAAVARVAGYEIDGELGRGGMGVVYKARQLGLNRPVALKMILAGAHAGSTARERFRIEAEAVARLQHPSIVQIYEIGESDGLPFFSLEFVDGGGLDQRLDGTPWPVVDAAALVEALARGVEEAHRKGVVHRDLKPANVLMTRDGRPKIADFGLAKQLGSAQGQTQSGAIMGTPSYMAPEQAAGQTREVGPAADIYALGAILYELLTGRPPFKAATPLETAVLVVSNEPVPPGRLRPGLPRDLETITTACLQKDPARRYRSSEALADDLARFLQGEPIQARPVGVAERAVKWVRRRPGIAALLGLLAIAVVTGITAFAWQYRQTVLQKDQAEDARIQALAEKAQADDARKQALTEKAQAEREKVRADAEKAQAERETERADARYYAASTTLAYQEWLAANPGRAARLLESFPPGDRHWEWDYLNGLARNQGRTLRGHQAQVHRVAFADGGRRVVSADATGSVRVWDAATGVLIREVPTKGSPLAFSLNGRRAAVSTGRTCVIWDLESAKPLAALEGNVLAFFQGSFVSDGVFSPDGLRFAAGGTDHIVYVWEIATGQLIHRLTGHSVIPCVAFSADGRSIASAGPTTPQVLRDQLAAGGKPEVRIWDAATGVVLRRWDGPRDGTHQVAFSPDGKRLAGAGMDGIVRVWDVGSGREDTLHGHRGFVYGVAFSPDGRRLASAAWERTLRIWDVATGRTTMVLRGHDIHVTNAVFSEDGSRLVSGSLNGVVKVWDLADAGRSPSDEPPSVPDRLIDGDLSQEYATLRGHAGPVQPVAFPPGSSAEIATGGWDGVIRLRDVETGRVRLTYTEHEQSISTIAYDRDGSRIVSAGGGLLGDPGTGLRALVRANVRVWDPRTGRTLKTMHVGQVPVSAAAFSPDGSRIASAVGGVYWPNLGQLKLWEAATGRELASAKGPIGNIRGLAYSPDGTRIATVGSDPGVHLWDPNDGLKPAATWGDGTAGYIAVTYSHDGRLLAAPRGDSVIQVFDARTGQERGQLSGHGVGVYALAFHPAGDRLASAGGDATVKLWDLRQFQEVLSLRQHDHEVYGVTFSPDGRLLASAGYDGAVRIRGQSSASVPETGSWKVIFADDFNRSNIGDRWDTGVGRWSTERGALRGTLVALPNQPSRATAIPRGLKLPSTVEIRFDCWTPDPILIESKLLSTNENEGVLAQIQYPDIPVDVFGAPGGRLMVRSGGYFPIASAPRFEARQGVHYHVRVVRTPESVTMFVDDRKIVSSPIPAFDAPVCHLQGVWGRAEATVYFDNVEIRASGGAGASH